MSILKKITGGNKESAASGHPKTPPFVERMEGLATTDDLNRFNELLGSLAGEWLDDGFELSDVVDYVKYKLRQL